MQALPRQQVCGATRGSDAPDVDSLSEMKGLTFELDRFVANCAAAQYENCAAQCLI
jgi:hypothetical protein